MKIKANNIEHKQRFSLRKLSIGFCSVALSVVAINFTSINNSTVKADEVKSENVVKTISPSVNENEENKTTVKVNTSQSDVGTVSSVKNTVNDATISKTNTNSSEKESQVPVPKTYSSNLSTITQKGSPNTWKPYNNNWYYYDNNGELSKNKSTWLADDLFYFNDNGTAAQNSWKRNDNSWYYFGSNGHAYRNGNAWIDSNLFHFNNDGTAAQNSWKKSGNDWYYFGSNGHAYRNGNAWVDSNLFHFNSNGSTAQNTWENIGNNLYYFGNDGHAYRSGGTWLNGNFFYFNSNGVAARNAWKQSNNNWYYFGSNGHAYIDSNVWISGIWYYMDKNGHPYKLSMIQEKNIARKYYTSQYDPIFAPWGCASSALSMLMKYDGNWKNVPGSTEAQKLKYMQDHLPQNYYGGQIGNPYTGAGFRSVITPRSLTNYAHSLGDSKIKDISGISLSDIAKLVESGHPVLYYGWSSYDGGGNKARNHCKVIFGYDPGTKTFLVDDPLYQYKHYYRGGGGEREGIYNGYDLGPITWVSTSSIEREFRGNALTIS